VAGSGLLALAGCVLLLGVLLAEKGVRDAAAVAGLLSAVLALSAPVFPLFRWWRRGTTVPVLTADHVSQARETLVGVIAGQWHQEALARSLGDPEPMPVHWRLTERTVMDHSRLVMAGRLSFAGRSDRIGLLAKEFRRLRRRRLVILGGAGSGKTTLAVQLLLELLASRQAGEPIPVLFSLAGWNPIKRPHLHRWLAARLVEDYPSLRAFGADVARALAEQGQILPILDGLDELPAARRPEVIAALNASLTDADQLVLTSRTVEYGTTVREAHDVLTAAAVIEPEPLTPVQAAEYLKHCLPPEPGSSWLQVLDQLRAGTAGHLATALATPLGLWLLRTVYITPRADPAALLRSDAINDPSTMHAHLFDQLIPAVLAARPASRNPTDVFRPRRVWNPNDVRHWLSYLAHHLDQTRTRDLLWWHIARRTLTRRAFGLISGLAFGLTLGLVGAVVFGLLEVLWFQQPGSGYVFRNGAVASQTEEIVIGLAGGLRFGLAVGLANGMAFGLAVRLTRRGVLGLMIGLAVGLLGALAGSLVYRLLGGSGQAVDTLLVQIAGLVGGLVGALAGRRWLTDEPAYANLQLMHRAEVLTRNLAGGLLLGLMVGPPVALVIGLADELVGQLRNGLFTGLAGVTDSEAADLPSHLALGLAVGLTVGLTAGLLKWAGTPNRLSWASTPDSTYKATHMLTVLQVLLVGLAVGLAFGLVDPGGLSSGLLIGLVVGLPGGLAMLSSGAWLSYILALIWLAAFRQLPLRLMSFLADAHRLGLLRTTGPAYQFRHAEFHDHLARAAKSRVEAEQDQCDDSHYRGH